MGPLIFLDEILEDLDPRRGSVKGFLPFQGCWEDLGLQGDVQIIYRSIDRLKGTEPERTYIRLRGNCKYCWHK
jgi:hypothetical protein